LIENGKTGYVTKSLDVEDFTRCRLPHHRDPKLRKTMAKTRGVPWKTRLEAMPSKNFGAVACD